MTTEYTGQKYATERLVTDTIAYDVVGSTAKTIRVRRRRNSAGPGRRAPGHETAMLPVVLHDTETIPNARVDTLRLRKDGTYRRGSYAGARPLHFTDEPPVTRTDYSF